MKQYAAQTVAAGRVEFCLQGIVIRDVDGKPGIHEACVVGKHAGCTGEKPW